MEGEQFLRPLIELNRKQREQIFDKVYRTVSKSYYDPKFNGIDWPEIALAAKSAIVAEKNPEAFECALHQLVRRLGTSHTGVFHQSVRKVPARLAIGATFSKRSGDDSLWIAEDVHPGSPAEHAGLLPGDAVITVNGRATSAGGEQLTFAMGYEWTLGLRRRGEDLAMQVAVPNPSSRKQPHCSPTPITYSRIDGNVGYLRVSIFPTMLGLDLARRFDAAFKELSSCESLILDLRGNLGGGLGVLRLMSYLSPDKLPIGFTVTRKRVEQGYDKNDLPKLGSLPTHLPNGLAVLRMAAQSGGRDPSVVLVSEGLGFEKWRGKIAILVNEHTVSAGEMVAAFAAENGLATVFGNQTAGRLIPGSGVPIGHGFMLILPKAEYVTWIGRRYEGKGLMPDVLLNVHQQASENSLDEVLLTTLKKLKHCPLSTGA